MPERPTPRARTLARAEAVARQHAAEQTYRRDAMRAIRERLMADYHARQAEEASSVAEALAALRADSSRAAKPATSTSKAS